MTPPDSKERAGFAAAAAGDSTPELFPFDAGKAQSVDEHRRAAHGGMPLAAVSTPTGAPARVEPSAARFVAVQVLAAACGVTTYELQTHYFPGHWAVPRDWNMTGAHLLVKVAAVPEMADMLGDAGRQTEAEKLRRWWMAETKSLGATAPHPSTRPAPPPWYAKENYA